MKTNLLCYVLCLGMLVPIVAMGAPLQDLDRVNDIVNSARALADDLRGQAIPFGQAVAPQGNPFSTVPAVGGQALGRTGVDVGSNNIRINAGGREFNIPRIGGDSGIVVNPPRSDGRVGDALREAAVYKLFADSVSSFRQADFETANTKMSQVAETKSNQFGEFHSLCRFALGDYKSSAEMAYAWAANHPVSSWNQLRSYYGDNRTYARQYVGLQNAAKLPTCNVSTRFLLGYHHLMLGHREHAAMVLNEVLVELPNDQVVLGLLKECELGPPSPIQEQ